MTGKLMVVATDGPDRLLVRRGDDAAIFTDGALTEFQDLQIWFKWAVWDEVEPYPFDEAQVAKGGSGSGNYGHQGRPGRRGGSASHSGGGKKKRTAFTGTFKPRGRRRSDEEGTSSSQRRGAPKAKPQKVTIPGGFEYELAPGEQMVDVGGGVKLPQGMVVDATAPFGYAQTGRGEPLEPRTARSRGASERSPFSANVSLEERVKQGIRALMGEPEMMTPSQRRQMRGLTTNLIHRLKQQKRSERRERKKPKRSRP